MNIQISRILRHGGSAFDEFHSYSYAVQYRCKGERKATRLSESGQGKGGGLIDEERHIDLDQQNTMMGGMVDEENHMPTQNNTISNSDYSTQAGMVNDESHIPTGRTTFGHSMGTDKYGVMMDEESHIPIQQDQAHTRIPLSQFNGDASNRNDQDQAKEGHAESEDDENAGPSIYFVCQRGNDSQIAAQKLLEKAQTEHEDDTGRRKWSWIGDVKGGFLAMEKHTLGD